MPPHAPCRLQRRRRQNEKHDRELCLHTLRADCNRQEARRSGAPHSLPPHAPCRLQLQPYRVAALVAALCLHTLRADCNVIRLAISEWLALCLHTLRADCNASARRAPENLCAFASTRSVQIATPCTSWCHGCSSALPPHAPCRLQRLLYRVEALERKLCLHTLRADCNSCSPPCSYRMRLCLHTLRADCNRKGQEND